MVLQGLARAQELGLDLTGIEVEVVEGDLLHSPRQWGYEDPTECSSRPTGVEPSTVLLTDVLARGCPECAHGVDDHSLRYLTQDVLRAHDEVSMLKERTAARFNKLGEVLHRTRRTGGRDQSPRVRAWADSLRALWRAEHEELAGDAALVRSWCVDAVRSGQGEEVVTAVLASSTTYLCGSTTGSSALGALLRGQEYAGIGEHAPRVTHLGSLGAHALGNVGRVFAALEVPVGVDGDRAAETAQALLRAGANGTEALRAALALEE